MNVHARVLLLTCAVPTLCVLLGGPPRTAVANDEPRAEPPLIGTTGYVVPPGEQDSKLGHYRVNRTYRDALVRAGAIPVHLVPVSEDHVDELLDRLDGLLLCGGPDIDPSLYGEETHPTVRKMPAERQAFDLALAREALARQMPILGICLGSQELNVLQGGAMIQDIPSEVPDALSHRELDLAALRGGAHDIELVPGTRVAALYETPTIRVNSAHHQASDVMADGLTVAARSADGVVEAYEREGYPFLIGVQFHPEMQTAPEGQHDRLFRTFVGACTDYRAARTAASR